MAKNTTTYALVIDGVDQDFTRTTKQTVINELVRRVRAKDGYKFEVVTGAGNVVYKASRRKVTKFTAPYTKTVDLPQDLAALVPDGYVAAYIRSRNGAVVLRKDDEDLVEDPSLYAVLNILTKSIAGYAPTTRDAGQIMKQIGAARKAA